MTLTRQHFELIADVMANSHDHKVGGCLDPQQHMLMSEAFADALEPFNPNFNRAKFLAACGVED